MDTLSAWTPFYARYLLCILSVERALKTSRLMADDMHRLYQGQIMTFKGEKGGSFLLRTQQLSQVCYWL